MADVALKSKSVAPLFTEGGLKALIGSILVYWGIYALIAPVTNSDSHVYDLSRLSVVERAGFWQPQPGIRSVRSSFHGRSMLFTIHF